MKSKNSLAKKPKQAFWKKWGPESKEITDHIGHAIDNGHIIDYLLYGSLALIGAQATQDIRGALIGPIGLKLALSGNDIAGASGILILATLGLTELGISGKDIKNPFSVTSGLSAEEYLEKMRAKVGK